MVQYLGCVTSFYLAPMGLRAADLVYCIICIIIGMIQYNIGIVVIGIMSILVGITNSIICIIIN